MRKKNRAFAFKPFSPQQRRLMFWWAEGSPHRDCSMVIADGAIRSGKTIAMICGFFQWSLDSFPEGETFILAGKTIGALKRNVIRPALQILNAWGLPFYYVSSGDEARLEVGRNVYYLYDAHNEKSQDRLQGLTAAGALADEVALFPQNFIEQMIARCSVEGAKLWLNCNPESPGHYVKTELIDKAAEKGIYHLHFLMSDNLALSPKTRAMYERMYVGVFYRRFILGEWCLAEGLIYSGFNAALHVKAELPELRGRWFISIDYGTANPFSAGLWCVSGGKAYRVREYYFDSREQHRQHTDDEYYTAMEELAGSHVIEAVVVDPSAASFIELIRRKGRFAVRKAKNEVLDGIRLTARLLNEGRILIGAGCKDAIREFGLYVWDEKAVGEDRPLKTNDHAMDEIRYFCATILRPYDRSGALED
ncbi:MAG: PBSX family phage terminase large subunit [Oscillospiraceae bacterium]|nr:PBSX family phage terminase large subunit [Oscillospiraceae bacterium]